MADLMDIIKGRRSMRKYQEKEIPEESLDQILESVRWAPSWANTQCWEVIIVKDPGIKEQLQATLIRNPATKAMAQAPVVLVLCGKLKISGYYEGRLETKLGDWFMFDLGIASQNICLTAYNLGLGTVIVGQFDHNRVKGILGVPDDYGVVTMIPLGYPAKDPKAPKRREINDFCHFERF
jgi:nitroreductase